MDHKKIIKTAMVDHPIIEEMLDVYYKAIVAVGKSDEDPAEKHKKLKYYITAAIVDGINEGKKHMLDLVFKSKE
jgi:hypothetical protein